LKEKVKKNELLWLSFDRSALNICEEIEKKSLIYQNGIIGKVIWVKRKKNNTYDVGIKFLTREEKNLTHIYPKIYFLEKQGKLDSALSEEEEWDEEEFIPPQEETDDYSKDLLDRDI
ncbi:MAG: hypothetical protein N2Z79_01615, partial [Candidatus Omnitrophica bacterium]|nr:hypothetical protein [Candidatus Omnitrophota bacterium]